MQISDTFSIPSPRFPLKTKILVTCALPYSNGPFHIAHLRTYIPGDTFNRFLRKIGQETIFICGSDEHGTPILLNAEKKGVTPRQLSDSYHERFKNVLNTVSVHFDYYGRTDSSVNHEQAQEMVQAMIDKGYVYQKEIEQYFCKTCNKFLPDRFLSGKCKFCGSIARGDECDIGCGRHLGIDEIIDPTCEICKSTPSLEKVSHYFFKLSEFSTYLEVFINSMEGTKNAKNYALGWIQQGLNDWCISRNISWGVKFPGHDDLVMYVWVDAPIGYISFTKKHTSDWEYYWKNKGAIIHFIGPDIIYHHCVFWPAMLHSIGYNTPYAVVASGSVKIEGTPFSKTRGSAVWLEEDYLDNNFDPDVLRYYITSFTGQTKDLDFSWSLFREKTNNELVAILGNFVYRSLHFAYHNFGEIPEYTPDDSIREKIIETVKTYWAAFDKYEFKEAIDSVIILAKAGNEYFQRHKPWDLIKVDKHACKTIVGNALFLTKAISILIEPFMPKKAEEIWKMLSQKSDIHNVTLEEVLSLEGGTKLEQPRIIFEKIEKKRTEALESALLAKIHSKDDKKSLCIEYGDFEKLKILVGTITDVEEIKGAKKLIKLKVDIGSTQKQVVAGIAEHYTKERLLGKKVILLNNLAPAKIRGIDSEGMILAAEDTSGISLLTVDRDVENGSRVL